MYIDRIEVSFDAGHRLLGHAGKCAAPHGHTYRAEVFFGARKLNELGLVIDFIDLKAHVKQWIDREWDHGFLINDRDILLLKALQSVPGTKLYLFHNVNPSAEAVARELFEEVQRHFGAVVRGVRIWESATQYAEFIPDDDSVSENSRRYEEAMA